VLDAMPTKHQAQARTLLCAMPDAKSQAACEALRDPFVKRCAPLAPKAVERLEHAARECGGVPVCGGPTAHDGSQTVQEGRLGDGYDLENAPDREEDFPAA
jgi:hypothetical protein